MQQASVPFQTPRIPFGTPIISYNQWTGFETTRFANQFRRLSGEETSNLTEGATVYVDVDPLHPNGKVYGLIKGCVTSVKLAGDDVLVGHRCEGVLSGEMRVRLTDESSNLAVAIDESTLADILDELPKATVIDDRYRYR